MGPEAQNNQAVSSENKVGVVYSVGNFLPVCGGLFLNLTALVSDLPVSPSHPSIPPPALSLPRDSLSNLVPCPWLFYLAMVCSGLIVALLSTVITLSAFAAPTAGLVSSLSSTLFSTTSGLMGISKQKSPGSASFPQVMRGPAGSAVGSTFNEVTAPLLGIGTLLLLCAVLFRWNRWLT